VREGVIEIQGDHRDAIVAELCKLGWAAKKSGG
jgi:translation initiation factor 1